MPEQEQIRLQDAELHTSDGQVERVRLPEFPGNPDLVVVPEGVLTWGLTSTRYFVLGLSGALSYHEVDVYELGGSDA